MRSGDDLEGNGRSKDSNRTQNYQSSYTETYWTSWLIPVFVVVNIAVFVVLMYVNDCPKWQVRCEVSRSILVSAPSRKLYLWRSGEHKLGALQWRKIVHGNQGWRLVTANWLHAGLIHIVANMLSLVWIPIGSIYLLSGFGGSILSSLFIQINISVAASGALFSLLGTMLSELITNWTMYSNKAAALITLIIVINLAVGILPFVDNFAHIGGFLTGFLLGFVLLPHTIFQLMFGLNPNIRLISTYLA